MKMSRLTVLVMILSLLAAGVAFAGKDLDAVKKKGFIQAGVNGGVFGFGMPDSKGVWKESLPILSICSVSSVDLLIACRVDELIGQNTFNTHKMTIKYTL